jgi:surfactin synthase thioesterase subunit
VNRDDVVWSVPERPVLSGPALLVLPHAGGNAHSYAPWREYLAGHVRLLLGQYPGRGARFVEPLPSTMDDLADPILCCLPPDADDLVVLGHSMGSLVAFEIARRLTGAGRSPRHLIVSACRSPDLPNPSPVHPETLSDDELVAVVQARGGTDGAILDEPELREIVLPAIRADFAIDDVYRVSAAAGALACPVTVLGGDADPVVPVAVLDGWARCTSGPVHVAIFPGGHFYHQHQMAAVMAVVSAAIDGTTSDETAHPSVRSGSSR